MNTNTMSLKIYLDKHPEIKEGIGEINKNFTEITFFKKDKNGFDITIKENKKELILYTETAYHEHFEYSLFKNKKETFDYVFGLTRDLLSKNMRIREIQKNNFPTKVYLEYNKNGVWEEESSIGILSWATINPFAQKQEIIYINDILRSRTID